MCFYGINLFSEISAKCKNLVNFAGWSKKILTYVAFEIINPTSTNSKREIMKVLKSLKSAKKRDKNCRVVRRKGRVFVINKQNPRFKAKQA